MHIKTRGSLMCTGQCHVQGRRAEAHGPRARAQLPFGLLFLGALTIVIGGLILVTRRRPETR